MLVTNQTTQDIYFGSLHLAAGVGQSLTIDDTSATSLYLLSDQVADAVNNAYLAGNITVSGQAQPFPRPTGIPQLLHGGGSPEGLVYAPQGSIYMRRDAASTYVLYVKTSGVTSSTQWVAVDTTGASVPTGSISQFGGSTAPIGWLLCDGSAVSRTTYAALFGVISTTYGSGDGSTTFNIPDLRGRVAVGLGTNASVSSLGGNDGVVAANRRGTKHRHTPHTHTYVEYTGSGSIGGPASGGGAYSLNAEPTSSADGGSGDATDPLDGSAFLIVNHIIKT